MNLKEHLTSAVLPMIPIILLEYSFQNVSFSNLSPNEENIM